MTAQKNKPHTHKKGTSKGQPIFLFGKNNYYLMFAGIALIVIGFLMMSGAKITDPNAFDTSRIYSFRRVTLAPILIIAGFVVEVFAIMRKPKEDSASKPS